MGPVGRAPSNFRQRADQVYGPLQILQLIVNFRWAILGAYSVSPKPPSWNKGEMTRGVGKGMVEIGGMQQCGYTGKERKRKGGMIYIHPANFSAVVAPMTWGINKEQLMLSIVPFPCSARRPGLNAVKM